MVRRFPAARKVGENGRDFTESRCPQAVHLRQHQGVTKRGQPQMEDLLGVRARPGYDVVDEARPQRDALVDTPWGRP